MRLSRYALMLIVVVLTAGPWSGECWAQAKQPTRTPSWHAHHASTYHRPRR